MKVCINEDCYKIIRVIKNANEYDQEFFERLRDNTYGSVLINDNNNNILVCKKIINYDLDPVDNKWKLSEKIIKEESKLLEETPVIEEETNE